MQNTNDEGVPQPKRPPFWSRLPTRRLQFMLDLVVLATAFTLAYALRFEFSLTPEVRHALFVQLPLVVLLQFVALTASGVYSLIWRYIGLDDLKAFVRAALWTTVPLFVLRLGLPSSLSAWRVPISVIIMDAILAFIGVLGIRLLRRVLWERYERLQTEPVRGTRKRPTLLIGAGRAGLLSVREILGRHDTDIEVRGFIDDDAQKHGSMIHGVRVLGSTQELEKFVRALQIEQVVITIAQAPRTEVQRIVHICEQIPVKVRIIPGLYEILGGKVQVNRIRDVEIEDLLGREAIHLDEAELGRFLAGRTVMVTGAGGSIGSELCRQVTRFAPGKLLLVERSEPALFHIDRELRDHAPVGTRLLPLLADVGDEPRMRGIFEEHRPHVVIHAAAHKHVPLMEDNPFEAIKNNVFGTRVLGELAGQHGVDVFVLVSTDKAVRPTSIMGSSKRIAELVVQDLDRRYDSRFLAVRFGNVLGSNGSVIPLFREQIRRGGPVTLTHPDMVRYFMTIPEAAQLVLQAGSMGEGGEIFVLD
ncbi:polysaccharide biosynthesis protein, partial [Myxococcota bacterium]|nr:polysaccharide biosynthesis protein [Myxococcota bacterium]